MRKQNFIFIFTLIMSFGAFSQTSNGQLIELTNNRDEIRLPTIDHGTIYIETEVEKLQWKKQGSKIPYQTRVGKDGYFILDVSELKGEYLTIYFSCDDYANVVIKNIPKASLKEYIKILPAIKNIWKSTCGRDCLTVDKKRTYKRKTITINNGINKMVFQRKIMKPKIHDESGIEIPIPFMNIWPPDQIYWYEFEYNREPSRNHIPKKD
ncbi:hypothetical protein [Flagellimonas sp.]|uniref:hypothetical protein n=1 Tax=Flagellimonas sp. TaxID=2058762 RepID=UPI003B5B9C2B